MTECRRCLMYEGIPGVIIGPDGICNYCKLHDRWELDNDPEHGKRWLQIVFNDMKAEATGEYDCVVGISGGVDSSYTLAYCHDAGLNPLAVHWNNGWNRPIATENIRKIVESLGVDLYQVKIPQREYNDLCKAFLLASTPDADIPNDIALTTVLYQACKIFDCKFIVNAHSFRTEGTTPLGWTYMDGGYIEDVHNRYGSIAIPHYPNLTYDLFKEYIELGIQRIRPLWSLNYNKQKAIEHLQDRFNWRWYKSHHGENAYTLFVGAFLWRVKFGIDLRYIEFSALIRSGFMSREKGKSEIKKPPKYPATLPYTVRSRLGMSKLTWDLMLKAPVKSYRDYNNYQARFAEDIRFFERALGVGLIPQTFFDKYVRGVQ